MHKKSFLGGGHAPKKWGSKKVKKLFFPIRLMFIYFNVWIKRMPKYQKNNALPRNGQLTAKNGFSSKLLENYIREFFRQVNLVD